MRALCSVQFSAHLEEVRAPWVQDAKLRRAAMKAASADRFAFRLLERDANRFTRAIREA